MTAARNKFPVKTVGFLLTAGVLLLTVAWHFTSGYADVRLVIAWETPVDAVSKLAIDPQGQSLLITQEGKFLSISPQGGITPLPSLPLQQVVELTPWGALVQHADTLLLAGADGTSVEVADFAPEAHVFPTQTGFLLAQAVAEQWTVGDSLQLWQGEEVQHWIWDGRVLLDAASWGDDYAGVSLRTSEDELTVMLCRFTPEGISWEQELGSQLPVGFTIVPGQALVALDRTLVAYDGEGNLRWTYQAATPILSLAAARHGSLVVEEVGSFNRYRFTHVDPWGEKTWQTTLGGQLDDVQTGGGWHALLLNGRLWLVEIAGGRVLKTQIVAHKMDMDSEGRYLIAVGSEGTVMRVLLDSIP